MNKNEKIKEIFKVLKYQNRFILSDLEDLDEGGCAYGLFVVLKPIFYHKLQIQIVLHAASDNRIKCFMNIKCKEDNITSNTLNFYVLEDIFSVKIASLINKKLIFIKMTHGLKSKFLNFRARIFSFEGKRSKFTSGDIFSRESLTPRKLMSSSAGERAVKNNRSSTGPSRLPKEAVGSSLPNKTKTNLYRVDKKICATCAYWCGGRDINSSGSIVTVEIKSALCLVSKMTKDPITNRPRGASPSNKAPHFGDNCKYHKRWP